VEGIVVELEGSAVALEGIVVRVGSRGG